MKGLQRVPFVGPAYRARSLNQSAQRCVNWYLESSENEGKTPAALYPTPGLVELCKLVPEVITYSTWSPTDKGASVTLSGVNTIATCAFYNGVRATDSMTTGKRRYEVTFGGFASYVVGVATASASLTNYLGTDDKGWSYYQDGTTYHAGINVAYGASFTSGDVIGVNVDFDAGSISFDKNGVDQGQAFIFTPNTPLYPMVSSGSSGGIGVVYTAKFSAFTYPKSGYTGWGAVIADQGAPVRGIIATENSIYAVGGNGIYVVDSNYNVTNIGTIGTIEGFVGLAYNGTQVMIVDGDHGYVISTDTNTLSQITDVDFPSGVTWVSYMDGYFIVGGDGSQRFYISSLNDGSTWDGSDYASAEGDPDPMIAGIVDHRELWLFGGNSVEVWYNTGNATFPFERTGNTFIEHGCAAVGSVAKLDNTIFWLGKDQRGDGIIWRAEGYIPQRISNHAIEYAIANYSRIDDAVAYTYQQEGHAFYVISFPSADVTWVYDVAVGEWHERAYFNSQYGTLHRHRSNNHVMFGRHHVVGDFQNNKLYRLDLDVNTDDGAPIKRIRSCYGIDNTQLWVIYQYLALDFEAGVASQDTDPKIALRWSNDGGHTWSNYLFRSLGKSGQYAMRAKWEQLGRARNRVWEISVTDDVKVNILGATTMATGGTT